jgi:3-dehydroquinate synthase
MDKAKQQDLQDATRTGNQDSAAFPAIVQEIELKFDYPVHFTKELFDVENPLLANVLKHPAPETGFTRRAICFVDEQVARAHPGLQDQVSAYFKSCVPGIPLVMEPVLVAGGETAKNDPAAMQAVMSAIVAQRLCRQCFVLAIGGGAVIDMVGYAAATAHRGIPLVRVPTTVLSQNDAALSVKNAVNAYGAKNYLGSFTAPHSVLCDATFLRTLDQRNWIGGVAEAVKVALLRDAEFFKYIEDNVLVLRQRSLDVMRQVIYRCARHHLDHISKGGDPLERGSSRPLDFGHWAAHKLESLTDYQLHHGEAVAVGLALDTTYSWQIGLLEAGQWERVINLLTELGLPVFHPALLGHLDQEGDDRCVLRGLDEFREHLGGPLTIMLLQKIGRGHEVNEMDTAVIKRSIRILEGFQSK